MRYMDKVTNNNIPYFGNYTISNQTAKNINRMGETNVSNIVCTNSFEVVGPSKIETSKLNRLNAKGLTQLFSSTVNEINSSGDLNIVDCPKIVRIGSFGTTSLKHCKEVGEIDVFGRFSLTDSQVTGNVTSFGEADIKNSSILGILKCSAKIVKISNSTIRQIVVTPATYSYSFGGNIELFNWKKRFYWEKKVTPQEQTVELSGKNCRVGSITFEEGVIGKVVLKDGAVWNGKSTNS